MMALLFQFSTCKNLMRLNTTVFVITVGIATFFTHIIAFGGDSKDNWIQYPPKAAVKLTEQINGFKELDSEKKESAEVPAEKVKAVEPLPVKEVPKPKTLVDEKVIWEKDHKTKNIIKKFSDGTQDVQTEFVEPVAGEPNYKGNLEMIPMSYADGVKSIITRKAKSEEYEWAKDHTTKTTIYKFSDGTTNIDIKSIPKKYSQPEFKNGFEKITITFGDGTQKTEENEAVDRRVSWSKDHLTQIIKYVFEDGKSYEDIVEVPAVFSKPIYVGDKEKTLITYGDGFSEEVIANAIDQKVSWSSDHLIKKTTYSFADGGVSTVEVGVPRIESEPVYKENIETFYYTYGDGTKTSLSKKATAEKVTWSTDHLTKTTEYTFADGTFNKVVSSVSAEVLKPIYDKDTETIKTKFGDGTVSSVVNKAIAEEVSWSEDHLFKTVTYRFNDGTTNQVVQSIPNQILPPSYKSGVETIKKVYGDGTEKVFTYEAVSQKEVWSNDHESKVIIYKFADGTTFKEEVQTPKIFGKPSYNKDIQTVTINFADGTVKTIKNKAVDSKIILSEDEQIKLTRYTFEDGTFNDVPLAMEKLKQLEKNVQSEKLAQPEKIVQPEKENVINKKIDAKGEMHKPIYLQGLEIITMTTSDGKTQTATFKAISKDEAWSKDGKTKFTTYKFEDGTTNKVTTDVMTEKSKMPKPSSSQNDDELSGHSLADD